MSVNKVKFSTVYSRFCLESCDLLLKNASRIIKDLGNKNNLNVKDY